MLAWLIRIISKADDYPQLSLKRIHFFLRIKSLWFSERIYSAKYMFNLTLFLFIISFFCFHILHFSFGNTLFSLLFFPLTFFFFNCLDKAFVFLTHEFSPFLLTFLLQNKFSFMSPQTYLLWCYVLCI